MGKGLAEVRMGRRVARSESVMNIVVLFLNAYDDNRIVARI